LDPEETLRLLFQHLGTRRQGLTSREAARRLEQHGKNEIRRKEAHNHGKDLLRQFSHPLASLLWVAAGLALLEGIVALAIAIVVVIVLNALFAFTQELQAERATEALQKYLPQLARVRRDARVLEVPAHTLVPGDVLLITEGERLSADARLIEGSVELDASPLTGESQPIARSARRSQRAASPLESEDLVFSGTMCVGGEAVAVVYATGMATQLGRVAALSQRVRSDVSPLQEQVNRVAKLIAIIAVCAGALFYGVGTLFAGLPSDASVNFAIGLLVANVPEGLLPTITLALAVGVRRMARRKALVKRLTAVETLGSTDVICTDKTGTLTEGTMTVRRFWADGIETTLSADQKTLVAEPVLSLLRIAVRCNNASLERADAGWKRGGDPSESALLLASASLGFPVEDALATRGGHRKRLFHFDARFKRMTTLDVEGDGAWYHAKGAPLELLERCTSMRTRTGDVLLDDDRKAQIARTFEGYAAVGMRVLGFAERPCGEDATEERSSAESGLCFVGLAALEDPPRKGVRDAVLRSKRAGIRIIVVTGDHGLTAAAIAREVGIAERAPRIVSGASVDAMSEADLDALLTAPGDLIVARSNPETKLHLVDALRARGHTVAMTGDGVNDAPALRRADIGVAMGASGTEVAREAATMVLTDDDFGSIVAAIEEGRVVYENIRKFITYIFAHTTPEVVPFLVFALSGGAIPLPLTALQILAIDLGTETLPALALGREPAEPGILAEPPRKRDVGIVDRAMLVRAWLWLGLLEAALVMGGFFHVLFEAGWSWGASVAPGSALGSAHATATTMTFAGIAACQIGTAFAARTTHASLREIGVFSNRLLFWGIAFEIAVTAAIIYVPMLQRVFDTAPLSANHLLLLATFPFIVWGSDELRRWVRRCRPPSPRVRIGAS
jgi:calcium-translocating P-type ATPase